MPAPEQGAPLVLTPDGGAPFTDASSLLVGRRGAYVLGKHGAIAAAFSGGPRADLGDVGRENGTWVDAAEVAALEGQGRWTLAVDDKGTIYRLRSAGGLEPLNARLGVPAVAKRVRPAGAGIVVLTDQGVYVVGQKQVAHLATTGRELAAAHGAVAVLADDRITLVDLESHTARAFALPGARKVALTEAGSLVVATDTALYRENGSGTLALRYVADDALGALATEGETIWFADGARVGALDDTGLKMGSPLGQGAVHDLALDGDGVWIVANDRALRLRRPGAAWSADVERIATSSCLPCHAPNGAGGFELTTASAFRAHRSDVARVLASGAMPPSGRAMDSGDRDKLLAWVKAM